MKRKEKVLTIEEIKERMIQTSQPNWLHAPPWFGILGTPAGTKILPLHDLAEQNIVLLFLLDAADYLLDPVLDAIERISNEYRGLPVRSIIAIEQKYLFLRGTRYFERFRNSKIFGELPVHLDAKGDWFSHFDAKEEPRIVILRQSEELLNLPLLPDPVKVFGEAEAMLHRTLRVEDPGLPLAEAGIIEVTKSIDRKSIPARELLLAGKWIPAGDSMATEDSAAGMSFDFEGSHLRIIAVTHPDARDNARFTIHFNDEPLPQPHYGANTRLGDKGSAIAEINRGSGICEVVGSSLVLKGKITIRFLNAVENPVILYGVRTA